ncbi:putative Phenazine biosynthesis-like domain-containing protein 1 [Hypsibius exemplaris]|uniref:Phenazine biosynthesis-like domain-containing protein 1 n=1 Tax=Hypsibius exemplaris TaxID=2072580 RepID=A0A1W0XF66_HYPEX|nr:putative Phenazine biosynthesis-like domain-containing protein 1 [Hypsibius exemplaris]
MKIVHGGTLNLPIYIADAFAKDALTGNPAAVCVLQSDTALSDVEMQRIAAEMNQTVTAFVCCPDTSTIGEQQLPFNEFGLRWFTPTLEINLCGHATLATAAVIFEIYGEAFHEVKFKTKSGVHSASLKKGFIELDFPLNPGHSLNMAAQADLQPLLDVCSAICGPDTIVDVRYSPGTRYLMVHLNDRVDLVNLVVDPSQFLAAQPITIKLNGVILTVRGSPQGTSAGAGYDFISRFFGPFLGIPEDHVCGSAHTVLAPYWTGVLDKDVKKARMVSKRGGDLLLDIRQNGRIGISGTFYIVDAFASKTFTGNPAAVCVLEQGMELSDEMMQRIAAEVNQTTTAFVRRCDRSIATIKEDSFIAPNGNEFDLRWFTPTMENPFCGHATLATSAVIFDIYSSVEQTQLQPLVDVCSAICGTDAIVAVRFSPGTRYMMVHLSDGVDLEKLIVDPSRFLAVQPQSIKLNGVILTVRGNLPEMATGSGYDFISRFFGPWLGIPEDHVCGSAHTVLAPYWTSVLGKDVKKARMVSTRGGDLLLDIRENGRIGIGGTCQIVLRGQFTL